jgi:predicted permease
MTNQHARGPVPRVALWLLGALLPEAEREYVIGDLLEDFHDHDTGSGGLGARAAFWRQTIAAVWALSLHGERAVGSTAPHGDPLMRQLWTDLRHAARSIRSAPGFAILCALTLGLGIGSTAAMFGIVDQILLHGPDHVIEPARVMRFYATVKHPPNELETNSTTSYAAYAGLRDGTHAFASVGAYQSNSWIVGTGVNARSLPGVAASADLFTTLGVQPYLGRFYSVAEDDPRSPQDVTVLAYEYWIRAFGGDRDILGRTITIAFRPFTVIGVAPPGLTGAERSVVNYWIPLSSSAHPRKDWPTTWQARWVQIIARVRVGVSADQASADATAAFRRAYTGPDTNWRDARISVRPISFTPEGSEPAVAPLARWLTGVTVVVLLIACANIGNLLLARALRRRGEMAVRLVLGMSRRRMIQLLLADGMLVALLGGAAGVAVAYAAGSGIRRFFLRDMAWTTSAVDPRVISVIAALTAIVSLVVSVTPLLQSRRIDLSQAVKGGARDGGGRHEGVRAALLFAQTALTAVLLIAAGLFVRSLMNVRRLDLGIDTDKVVAASVYWPVSAPGDSAAKAAAAEQALAWNRIRDSVAHRSDVGAASLVIGSPFRSAFSVDLSVPGRDTIPVLGGGGPYVTAVGDDYFRTAGTRILSGRAFSPHEGASRVRAAIVNQTMARTLWPHDRALGKCLLIGGLKECATIVGIVADAHRFGIREEPAMQYYVPLGQEIGIAGTTLLVRPRGPVGPAIDMARRTIASLAPAARYVDVASLQDRVDPQIRTWRVGAALFGAFAALAMIVAAAGLYSVIGYLVAQRLREFGVRIAVGATGTNIIALVVGYGVRVVFTGLSAAILIAWALGGRIGPQLFDESPHDPVIYVAVSATMLAVALLALITPAWRAARTDPALALRQE